MTLQGSKCAYLNVECIHIECTYRIERFNNTHGVTVLTNIPLNTGKYAPEKTPCLDTFHAVIGKQNYSKYKASFLTLVGA